MTRRGDSDQWASAILGWVNLFFVGVIVVSVLKLVGAGALLLFAFLFF